MRPLIAIVFVLSVSPALAAPLEFKGLVLDAPTTPEQVVEALRTECVSLGNPCDETWQGIHDRMAVACVRNILSAIDGKPEAENVVNKDVLK